MFGFETMTARVLSDTEESRASGLISWSSVRGTFVVCNPNMVPIEAYRPKDGQGKITSPGSSTSWSRLSRISLDPLPTSMFSKALPGLAETTSSRRDDT